MKGKLCHFHIDNLENVAVCVCLYAVLTTTTNKSQNICKIAVIFVLLPKDAFIFNVFALYALHTVNHSDTAWQTAIFSTGMVATIVLRPLRQIVHFVQMLTRQRFCYFFLSISLNSF